MNSIKSSEAPKRAISFADAVALIIGTVIGTGIFETPALIAKSINETTTLLIAWAIGGMISVLGALCYAELATSFPNVGGSYYFLKLAFGRRIAFLFAWARMTVIQTGLIALFAFVFGDYASQLLKLGAYSSSIYAACAIVLLTSLNLAGLQQGKSTQNVLTIAKVLGLLLVVWVGFSAPASAPVPDAVAPNNWGLALVFILFSYSGWNEAAYISAEIRDPQRNILRSLLWSLGIITVIYLLINGAYVRGLGLIGMANSHAVAATLMQRLAQSATLKDTLGSIGTNLMSILIMTSALGSLNATIFTGARTNYALGQDFRVFRWLGQWQSTGVPRLGFLVQGAIALLLVGFGTLAPRSEFKALVEYTSPVFWFFFLLTGIALFVLRQRQPDVAQPFRVPFYPFTPLLFCGVCGYLLYASLAYTGIHAIVGVAVVALGLSVLIWNEQQSRKSL